MELGWDDGWQRVLTLLTDRTGPVGPPMRIVRIDRGGIWVSATAGDEPMLTVAAKDAREVVVGDWVALERDTSRIAHILPRRTVFLRRAAGVSRDSLALRPTAVAANADVVLILQGLDAGVQPRRLARELALAWESGAEPHVVLTKADLLAPSAVAAAVAEGRRHSPGTEVHVVSLTDGRGLGEILTLLGPGRTLAVVGASGAGKSTLVNRLAGRQVQLTATVRGRDRRGRHTTTAGRLVPLATGGMLIDTPGMRSVGLWHLDRGLEAAFADLADAAAECRFTDCRHLAEPGCGVAAAVESGRVGADRWATWQALLGEIEKLEEDLVDADRVKERALNQRARSRAHRRDERGGVHRDGGPEQ